MSARSAALLALLALSCGHASPPVESAGDSPSSQLADDLRVRRIAAGVWMFTALAPRGEAANGLLIESADHATLIDTGWTAQQATTLARWSEHTLGRPITAAMITSADEDRLGGVPGLTALGVTVFASTRTAAIASERGAPIVSSPIERDSIPDVQWMFVRIDPSPEAIVAYHVPTRTVFGGRFIEALATTTIGRTGDADVTGWRAAFDLVAQSYPDAALVVPGRGEPGTLALVEHTRMLLAECHADDECAVLTEAPDSCGCCHCPEPRAVSRASIVRDDQRPQCQPICDGIECPQCPPTPEIATLHATCERGECTL